jgi:hypothetical protein
VSCEVYHKYLVALQSATMTYSKLNAQHLEVAAGQHVCADQLPRPSGSRKQANHQPALHSGYINLAAKPTAESNGQCFDAASARVRHVLQHEYISLNASGCLHRTEKVLQVCTALAFHHFLHTVQLGRQLQARLLSTRRR